MFTIIFKIRNTIIFLSLLTIIAGYHAVSATETTDTAETDAQYIFVKNKDGELSKQQQQAFIKTGEQAIIKARHLMPKLLHGIKFTVNIVKHDLSVVNGVTGRADRPNEIEISISSTYPGGIEGAITEGLESTLLHELHHTVRGWTIYGNKYGAGIHIAAVNEGLADVFAKIYGKQPPHSYADTPDFDAWAKEILALPLDANYGEWMFKHPDGREAIGYRTGAWLIEQAMKNSGKDILNLSRLSVEEIYSLAGY